MTTPLTLTEVSALPQSIVSDLTQLHWAVENWQIEYGRCAAYTAEAYRMFDEAIEDGLTPQEREVWEQTLDICETAQSFAYLQLDEAKRQLLAKSN